LQLKAPKNLSYDDSQGLEASRDRAVSAITLIRRRHSADTEVAGDVMMASMLRSSCPRTSGKCSAV